MQNKVDEMNALSQVMRMDGWQVLKDFLTNARESDLIRLASAKRELPDDHYRGRVDLATWFLDALPRQVEEFFREIAEAEAGPTLAESIGHPYAEEDGQPFLEGEDSK